MKTNPSVLNITKCVFMRDDNECMNEWMNGQMDGWMDG